MAIQTLFIGIDRYQDPAVKEHLGPLETRVLYPASLRARFQVSSRSAWQTELQHLYKCDSRSGECWASRQLAIPWWSRSLVMAPRITDLS